MTDPLSVIASITSIAAVTLHSTNTLIDFATKVKNAPKEIVDMCDDASNISKIVSSFQSSIQDPRVQSRVRLESSIANAVEALNEPLAACSSTNQDLFHKLKEFTKPINGTDGSLTMSTKRFKWYFSKTEINDLVSGVERRRKTLGLAMINLSTVSNLSAEAKGLVQEAAEQDKTDAGSVLLQYADSVYAKTVDGEPWSDTTKLQGSSNIPPPGHTTTKNQLDTSRTSYDTSNPTSERLQRASNQRQGLHSAARDGDHFLTQLSLEEGADINAQDADGKTALHIAAEYGNEAVARVLIERGADVNAKTLSRGSGHDQAHYSRRTPLHWACARGYIEMATLLVAAGADVNAENIAARTPLLEAAKGNHVSCINLLIDHGAKASPPEQSGWTPLHEACAYDHVAAEQALIARGVDLEARISGDPMPGSTPLHLATLYNKIQSVREMVKHKCDLEASNEKGETPMHLAAYYGDWEMLRVLLEAGAKINAKEQRGQTPLWKAIARYKEDSIRYLLRQGIDLSEKDMFGDDAIDFAVRAGAGHVGSKRVLETLARDLPNESRVAKALGLH